MLKFMSERPNLTFVKWPVAVLLLLIVAAWSYQCYLWPYFITDHQLVKIVLKPHWWAKAEQGLRVEVVKSEAAKQQGLSNRPSLISQDGQSIDGMLFVYLEPRALNFWMKDMHFDLDLCWFQQTQLSSCTRQASRPETALSDEQLAVYHSPAPSSLVLETLPSTIQTSDQPLRLFIDLSLF